MIRVSSLRRRHRDRGRRSREWAGRTRGRKAVFDKWVVESLFTRLVEGGSSLRAADPARVGPAGFVPRGR